MCGICGIASARGSVDPGRIAAMSSTLVHRGPDSDGTFLDGPVGLAARRLAIIDLQTGDQPITREEHGATVVQNGEIYNYAELRHELQRDGHRFSTSGDTEVLIHLYAQHGDGVRRAAARDVRACALGLGAQPAPPRARPIRDQAALLPRRRRRARVRLGAAGAPARRGRPGRARRVPRLQLGSRPDDDLQ